MEMTLVLAGLQLDKATIQHFRQGLKTMTELKESSYYKLVHGEGRVEGRKEGLEKMTERLFTANNWRELIDQSQTGRN